MSTTTSPDGIFYPVEHAILSDWLARRRPECARDIDLDDFREDATEPTDDPWSARAAPEGSHFRLREPLYGVCGDYFNELDNAVARICLEAAQGALPQWSTTRSDGTDVVARRYDSVIERHVKLLPRLILEINWATSGPGYSWPEAYFLTYVPYYDTYIVTASQDSPDVHGYTDEALAPFSAHRDVPKSIEEVLKGHWATMRDGYQQQHWENVFYEGLVSSEQAWRWAEEVWREHACDEVDWEEETSVPTQRVSDASASSGEGRS